MGKTDFINRVLGGTRVFGNSPIVNSDAAVPGQHDHSHPSKLLIRVRQQEIIDNDVRATLQIIDAPRIGYSVRKAVG
jgi:septin family protein